ncbi:MAG: aconitase/3-isopropylmalate dehydratase large subunit family protein [Symbiobacteriaceae bacterium]|nr:aconitase/3-isopropylmalate dehydratase large subunit family protein [Symbiobacteriaceae bacterium]
MPAQTIIEKLLSRHIGHMVYQGETHTFPVDFILTNDASGPLSLQYLEEMEIREIPYPDRILMVIDHYVPCPDAAVAKLQQQLYDFAARHPVGLIPAGEGIAHQVSDELGYLKPGTLAIGGDSHTTTYGYLNCAGIGMGASDVAMAMAQGELWLMVPETLLVEFTGSLKPGISGKEVALFLVSQLGAERANYCAVEFTGSGLTALSMDDRRVICNMLAECNVKCALMPWDDVAEEYGQLRGIESKGAVAADKGCSYREIIKVDLSSIDWLVALPHSPYQVAELASLGDMPIDMVLLGTCTNGRLADFVAAHRLLQDWGGAFRVETILVPASRQIYLELIASRLAADFLQAGAMVLPPSCGPCCGSSPGVPRNGFKVVSTANRNFLGRMGNTTAGIYLASPLVATAAALTGRLVKPLAGGWQV